jgi:hypothetical protein
MLRIKMVNWMNMFFPMDSNPGILLLYEIKFLDNRYNQLKESKFHDLLLEADQGERNYMMAYTGDLHRARQWGWWVNVNKDKVKEDTGGVSLWLSHLTSCPV